MIPLPPRQWPPVIEHKAVPRPLVWRDRLSTLAMWGIMAWLCRRSISALVIGLYDLVIGKDFELPDWHHGLMTLRPYLGTALLLGLWIVLWGLVTLWRRESALHLPTPQPLLLSEEAQGNHCSVEEIMEWRQWRISVVNFSAEGHPRVRPPA